MRESLLLIERIIIESLSKKNQNVFELAIDTNLDQGILLNILPNLLMKNLIKYNRGIYSIEKENIFKWSETINKKSNVKEEAKEIFTSMVNEYFREEFPSNEPTPELKIQKIWLNNSEEKILKGHLLSIENFFNSIKENRKKFPIRERTHEQKVVIWGFSNYSDLVHGLLETV